MAKTKKIEEKKLTYTEAMAIAKQRNLEDGAGIKLPGMRRKTPARWGVKRIAHKHYVVVLKDKKTRWTRGHEKWDAVEWSK